MNNRFFQTAAVLLVAGPLSAALLTTPQAGVTTVFPGGTSSCSSAGTANVAGFVMTGTGGDWCPFYSFDFSLGNNGRWSISLVGDASGRSQILIDLGGLYSSVSGFMNYAPERGPALIEALAEDGVTVLESYNLTQAAPIFTPGLVDDGEYRGIARAAADIRYFRFGGAFSVMHDITLGNPGAPTPEPATSLLLLSGVAALGIGRLRRRRA